VSNVRNAYWDYVFATQSVDVAKRSVALAEQLVQDNQTRIEIGTMAPIDKLQAESQAATQRQNLATAEGTRRTAELTLKSFGASAPCGSSTSNCIRRRRSRKRSLRLRRSGFAGPNCRRMWKLMGC